MQRGKRKEETCKLTDVDTKTIKLYERDKWTICAKGVFNFSLSPKLLLFDPIFWQNGSKQYRKKNLGCKTFGIGDLRDLKLGKNIIGAHAVSAWLKFCHACKH